MARDLAWNYIALLASCAFDFGAYSVAYYFFFIVVAIAVAAVVRYVYVNRLFVRDVVAAAFIYGGYEGPFAVVLRVGRDG